MRISSSMMNQSALANLMTAQRDQFQANQQVNTGMKAPDLKGYGYDVESILTGKGAIKRAESQVDSNQRLANRAEVQDLALGRMSEALTGLREKLTTTDGSFAMNDVNEAFEVVRDSLNTKYNGAYVFGGTRSDREPFNAETLADVQAAADPGDLFENSDRKQSYRIDENAETEIAPLASDMGEDLMGFFKRMADFDQGADGPFDGEMSADQRDFVQDELQNLIGAFDTVNAAQAKNGSVQRRLDEAVEAGKDRIDLFKNVVAEQEEVDMAEAVSRLTQAETAVQLSAATFSRLNSVSLLPFLS